MKRIIVVVMGLLLIICLAGCSEKEKKEIVKNELTQYVNNLSKAEIIKNDMKHVINIIDSVDKMKNVKK